MQMQQIKEFPENWLLKFDNMGKVDGWMDGWMNYNRRRFYGGLT